MTKARAKAPSLPEKPVVEELKFRSENAYLCLLVNRRNKLVRVIDFRAGALPAKRLFIQSVAKQEDIQKVITLVEKDEVSSWTRVGFVREGTIPGFYKRSDGHLCGCVVGDKTASIEVTEATQRLAEKTINAARKGQKDVPEKIKGATAEEIDEESALELRDAAVAKNKQYEAFDAFGRDAARLYYKVTMKGAKDNVISAEYQDCFGHALIEILHYPDTEKDVLATTHGVRELGENLKERGIVAAFAFAAVDDVPMATVFTGAGYRKTGLLALGVQSGKERKDAILWTRKLANPGGDELEE
ncbi:MAG: hypothetical protein U0230_19760 [Polyangiales bacterium]